MWVAELWRYPVKSMAGERLTEAEVRVDGILGDRLVQVRDLRNRLVTSRSHPALLSRHATLGRDGVPFVDGKPWTESNVEVEAGAGAKLVAVPFERRFDILPLLVATDGAVKAFGHDRRRLRPNILLGGVQGLAEQDWQGRRLRIGKVVIQLADLRERCIMTTYDPDTGEQDVNVLLKIRREFDGKLALNASVAEEGVIREGDAAEVL